MAFVNSNMGRRIRGLDPVLPPTFGDPFTPVDPATPPPFDPSTGMGGGIVPGDGLQSGGWQGWRPPNGGAYGPGSAPGYGTSMDPEKAPFNLFADARSWLSRNSQIFDPYQGQMTAGNNQFQMDARNNLRGFLGGNPMQYGQQGAQIASDVGMYRPDQVQAGMVPPSQAGYAGNVTGGSFASGDWGAYMNPFTQNVVDTSLADLERSRQIANASGARSADASTYGGDRNALIEAETNRGYADAAARTSAQLRSQGFDTAAGLMGQDLSRGLTAGLANQGTLQGLNQYNTSALNNMGQFNAGLGLQANLANQQAGLQGGQLRLGAANTLGSLGSQMFGQGLQGASALNQFGTQDQATQQADLTNQYNEYMRSMYGPMEGYNFLGGLLSGKSYQTPGGPGAIRGALGGAATGASIGSIVPGLGTGLGALIGGGLGFASNWF